MEQTQPTPTKKRILIIEDEHFISELYVRALTKVGYEVVVESDGEKGLKQAQTDTFDIILLDIMVPTMTGFEILKRLRDPAISKPVHSRVIISTNLEQSDEDRADIERQADAYVVKAEMTPRQLVDFLNQVEV